MVRLHIDRVAGTSRTRVVRTVQAGGEPRVKRNLASFQPVPAIPANADKLDGFGYARNALDPLE
jgi:hypothetical protein